jgi:hypothetical protein
MIAALAMAVALAAPAKTAPPPRLFDHLTGCWRITGNVRGKPAHPHAKGGWVMDRQYFLLQLASGPRDKPYKAAIFFGRTEDGHVVVVWLDPFGGEFSQTEGRGAETPEQVVTDFPYPDGPTRNEITRTPQGWRMLVTETPTGQPTRVFSDYLARPAPCSANEGFVF